jgi:DNA polymerase elongation subunit (family B)
MVRGYKKEILDYIKLKFETVYSDVVIARDVVKTFEIVDRDVETVRKYVNKLRKKTGIQNKKKEFKRLFFDIETSYVKALVWRPGDQYVPITNIRGRTKIICISYKWQHEDKVQTLTWDKNHSDRKMVETFIKVLGEADEIVAHNGDRFDIKHVRTRAIDLGLLMYTKYRTNDTLKKARRFFNFLSNKLDYIGEFLEVGRKVVHEGMTMWEKVQEGTKAEQKEYLDKMVEYCEQDVILLQDAFTLMVPYIDHNTNYAVLSGGAKWQCPECGGKDVKLTHTDTTAMGYIKRHMRCTCKKSYHISNRSYQDFLVYQYQNSDE